MMFGYFDAVFHNCHWTDPERQLALGACTADRYLNPVSAAGAGDISGSRPVYSYRTRVLIRQHSNHKVSQSDNPPLQPDHVENVEPVADIYCREVMASFHVGDIGGNQLVQICKSQALALTPEH